MSSVELLHLAEAAIGAVRIGIPADSVLQAIALPSALAPLPRRHGALAGVVDYEGRLVPVVDLARWVDVGTAPAGQPGTPAAAHVLILHAEGRTIGLQVDTVGGLAAVAPQDVTRLHHDEREDEVFHCVAREEAGGRILSLLDVDRLARLAAAWHQDADWGQTAVMQDHATRAPSAVRAHAVLQAGAARLALAAEALTEVLPMPALDTLGAGSGVQYCIWRGRHLPVLSLSALGLDAMADGAAPALLAVVEHGGLALGLPVHAALSLQDLDTARLTTRDETMNGLLSPLFDADGAPLRVLDEARLFARFPEAALSRDDAAGPGARSEPGQRAANATAYIVFEGDGMYAAAIDTVERIVSLREAATDGKGAMAWEGRSIALRDLRTAGVAPASGDVMVVRSQGAHVGYTHVGYIVSRVHLLVPPGSGRIYRMGGAGAGWEFIATGDNAAQASYRIVELGALAA